MTIGFGAASTLLLLGFVVLVFVLLGAAAKDAGYKLNLGSDEQPKEPESFGGEWVDYGSKGPGYYHDSDSDWPIHKIG